MPTFDPAASVAVAVALTPEWASVLCLLVSTVGSIAVAWLKSNAHAREAAALDAVIQGVEVGVRDLAGGDPSAKVVKDAVRAAAEAARVQDHLDARVQAVTKEVQ